MNSTTLIQAWRLAAEDLGIEIVAPFVLSLPSGEQVHADVLVKDFGPMLVSTEAAEEMFRRLGDQLAADGYGYSVFCGEELAYDRKRFVEVLRDWGWTGEEGRWPGWYDEAEDEGTATIKPTELRSVKDAAMNADLYDETEALNRYLAIRAEFLMTEFERRCLYLAIKREKAAATEFARDRLPRWLAEESEEVRQASLAGTKVIYDAIQDRIDREYREGTLVVNRCPRCHRIVRTPLAKQCLWCGHDWHGT